MVRLVTTVLSGARATHAQQKPNANFMHGLKRLLSCCCFVAPRLLDLACKHNSSSSPHNSTPAPLQGGPGQRKGSRQRNRAAQTVSLGPTSSFADMTVDVELARRATLGAALRAASGAVKALANSPSARASAQVAKTFILDGWFVPALLRRRKCLRWLPLLLPASGVCNRSISCAVENQRMYASGLGDTWHNKQKKIVHKLFTQHENVCERVGSMAREREFNRQKAQTARDVRQD